jgi:glutathione synthase
MKSSSHLWITDPWPTLDHSGDTTVRFMQACLELKMPCFWADGTALHLRRQGKEPANGWIHARQVKRVGRQRRMDDVAFGPLEPRPLTDFRWAHYRCDPPIDHRFFHHVQMLGLAELLGQRSSGKSQLEIVNSPRALLLANEKFGALPWSPESIISSNWTLLEAFGKRHGVTVFKPLALAQSKGVTKIQWKGATSTEMDGIRARLAEVTQGFRVPILLQAFNPGIASGEDRLWFVDGEMIAHVRKYPMEGDFRVLIDHGSRIGPAELSSAQKKFVPVLGEHLLASGVRLAAVDVVGTEVIDFNVTSPGLIVQVEEVLGRPVAPAILKKFAPKRAIV